MPSVTYPQSRPSLFTMVFTLPMAREAGLTSSRYGMTAFLSGMVTLQPWTPKVLSAATPSATCSMSTSKAR